MFEVLVSHWGLTPMWHDLSVEIPETDTSYSVVYEFNLEMTGGIFNLCNTGIVDTIELRDASSIHAIMELQIQLIEELHLQFN